MRVVHYFADTSVFAYALGGHHVERAPARAVITAATAGELVLHASVEMVQELLHHRMRRGDRAAAVRQARAAGELCVLHAFDDAVLGRALDLVSTTPTRGRDAVHAATALHHGVSTMLSTDPDFDTVPGLTRITPGEAIGTAG